MQFFINILLLCVQVILFVVVISQNTDESITTMVQTTTRPMGPMGVDILSIYVPPGIGNAVKLVWGDDRGTEGMNLTYGVYYGIDESELEFPKLTTSNQSMLIEDLEYCTTYHFAVTLLEENGNVQETKINPYIMRTLITGLDHMAAPINLTVDFEPKVQPCIDIKWSAACPNVVAPIGYVLSIFDKKLVKYKVMTLARTKRSDLVHRMPVNYGDMYEIRVSTNFPGSKAVGPFFYEVPQALQPFKLKVTVNKDDDAFLIYWKEPYVPLTIGRYYYQVFVYPGRDLEAPYEKYYVTRPVMVYKGERGEYSFSVNFASSDRKHVSAVTTPVYANLNGEVYELNATFTETPDR
ncbi:uncharacterized protein LOC115875802 isoform X2 [Sitophilus oryzae]|uniref:Uncharacterized protein LOC115875802 isoform X2 n=1 Tax=Sitophilus oryzae TaxID=7048 RepID=A0A6J2X7F7_SITOR|nr:uncharacterized protein LOC115875802 isoform X2 [Sitophilus oryzae]